MKTGLPFQTEDFLNIPIKGFRAHNHIFHEFTLAELLFVNPYDWISLFHIVAKDLKKYEPNYEHLKKMIKCNIMELAKMNVEIASVLKRKPILKPFDQPQNIANLRGGLIDKEYWKIVYKKKGGEEI